MTARLRYWVAAWILLWSGGPSAAHAAQPYRWGNGMDLGQVNLAGYANLEADAPRGQPDTLNLDLSAFVSGHFGRYLNPFTEAEIDELTLAREQGSSHSGTFTIERLYNDFYLRPSLTLRVGKMLTPVGEWNVTHAPPLVWTVNRPLATYYSFPEFTSGASLHYQWDRHGLWDARLYAQPGKDLFWKASDYRPRKYTRVLGVDIRYSKDSLSRDRIGLSWQTAHLPQSHGDQEYVSIYGGATIGPIRWSFQVSSTRIHGNTTPLAHQHEHGGYLQAVYPVTGRWYLIAQGERYQTRDYPMPALRRVIGAVYRPQPAISWKLDYLNASGASTGPPTGVYAALAVLF